MIEKRVMQYAMLSRVHIIYGLILLPLAFSAQDFDEKVFLKNFPKSKNDTNKVNAMHNYCRHLIKNQNNEKALLFSDSALKLARKLKYYKGEIVSYDISGSIYFNQNDFEKALVCDRRKLEKQQSLNNVAGVAAAQEALGTDFVKLNMGDSALHYLKLSHAAYKAVGNREGLGNAACAIGSIYLVKQDYGKAITFCKESVGIFEELKDKTNSLEAYTILRQVYNEIGNTPLAHDYEVKINRINKEMASQ